MESSEVSWNFCYRTVVKVTKISTNHTFNQIHDIFEKTNKNFMISLYLEILLGKIHESSCLIIFIHKKNICFNDLFEGASSEGNRGRNSSQKACEEEKVFFQNVQHDYVLTYIRIY